MKSNKTINKMSGLKIENFIYQNAVDENKSLAKALDTETIQNTYPPECFQGTRFENIMTLAMNEEFTKIYVIEGIGKNDNAAEIGQIQDDFRIALAQLHDCEELKGKEIIPVIAITNTKKAMPIVETFHFPLKVIKIESDQIIKVEDFGLNCYDN